MRGENFRGKASTVALILLLHHFKLLKGFNCDLAKRPNIKIADDPAQPLIESRDLIKPALEILWGGIPGNSIGLFLVEKLLTNIGGTPGTWDQVKERVEKLIDKKIDDAKLSVVCDDLKEIRKRITLCEHDRDKAKTECLKHLLDYVFGKEAHFKGADNRSVALLIGPYTLYTVLALAIGNMFIKQNKDFPVEGAATLEKIKPAAREFSEYVNASIPQAIEWRKSEIGHYKKYRYVLVKYVEDGSGIAGINKRRVIPGELDGKSYAHPRILLPKGLKLYKSPLKEDAYYQTRGLGYPPTVKYWGKLVMTDEVLGTTIFEKEARGEDIDKAYKKLFQEAMPVVENLRREEAQAMMQVFEEDVLPITNQYWRVYDGEDFGNIEAEATNKEWLDKTIASENQRRLKNTHKVL